MTEWITLPYAGGTVDITWVVIGAILIATGLYLHWRIEKKDKSGTGSLSH
jgi:LPXTG-motif cell wall-anchored protein